MPVRLEPAFIPGQSGSLHTTLFASGEPSQRALLLIPPFAEELNKCRPMMAAVARRVAGQGIDSLLIDLYGTGDSSGDFADATWARWCEDIRCGWRYLKTRGATCIHLVAVRTGALLVGPATEALDVPGSKLVLWQPVVRGADFWRQFLRVRLAAQALREDDDKAAKPQEIIERDGAIEIAGYTVSAALAAGLSDSELTAATVNRFASALWTETTMIEPLELSANARRTLEKWQSQQTSPRTAVIAGDPFWSTPEIAWSPSLVDATSSFLL